METLLLHTCQTLSLQTYKGTALLHNYLFSVSTKSFYQTPFNWCKQLSLKFLLICKPHDYNDSGNNEGSDYVNDQVNDDDNVCLFYHVLVSLRLTCTVKDWIYFNFVSE